MTCAIRVVMVLATLAGLPLAARAASTVQLKNGASLRGEILAEKPDRIVVDLGFTVVTVPRDEVEDVTSVEAGASSLPKGQQRDGDLFRVAANPTMLSVKENVTRVADAVVQVRTPVGLGSGFIIHPAGYVVTNEHVVAGEYNLTVIQFRRGATELERVNYTQVRIVALDSRIDLALLKIEGAGDTVFPTVTMGESPSLTDGQTVFAIGSPLGLERTVSQGIVSLRDRLLDGQLYIQTTTQINPGNSGGPLFNLRGEVVGVNNMKAMMQGIEGLNFAIPVDVLRYFLHNRDAFAFDSRNPNAGYRYLSPTSLLGKKLTAPATASAPPPSLSP